MNSTAPQPKLPPARSQQRIGYSDGTKEPSLPVEELAPPSLLVSLFRGVCGAVFGAIGVILFLWIPLNWSFAFDGWA